MKLDNQNLKLFWKYIEERQSIYNKKLQGSKAPWTTDAILSKYKFTNVFRELDPGTKYVTKKIIPSLKKPEDIIFNLIIYRLYNKIETMNYVGLQHVDSFNKSKFENKLRELSTKEKVFTNAFIVSGYSFIEGKDKIAKTSNIVNWVWKDINKLTKSIMEKDSENTFETLKTIRGIGNFLAYQIAVDIGYWNNEAFDENKFVVAGPGCKSGIDWLFEDRGNMSYEECIAHLCSIQEADTKILGKKLNLMAMENCLCEISKYLKMHYGKGRPRNKYSIRN